MKKMFRRFIWWIIGDELMYEIAKEVVDKHFDSTMSTLQERLIKVLTDEDSPYASRFEQTVRNCCSRLVKDEVHRTTVSVAESYVKGEAFIDNIIKRVNNKQLDK